MLVCVTEPRNTHDRNAVVVKKKKDGTVIGHLPKFRGCKIFVSLIFVTRKIFNTTKISAYTVFVFFFYIIYHIAGNIGGELNLADWRFGKETAR